MEATVAAPDIARWKREGYLVMRELISPEHAARLLPICNRILQQWRDEQARKSPPADTADATEIRHLNQPSYFNATQTTEFREIMDTVADEQVLQFSAALLDSEALFRCTTYWFNPTRNSSDGNWHRDQQFI